MEFDWINDIVDLDKWVEGFRNLLFKLFEIPLNIYRAIPIEVRMLFLVLLLFLGIIILIYILKHRDIWMTRQY